MSIDFERIEHIKIHTMLTILITVLRFQYCDAMTLLLFHGSQRLGINNIYIFNGEHILNQCGLWVFSSFKCPILFLKKKRPIAHWLELSQNQRQIKWTLDHTSSIKYSIFHAQLLNYLVVACYLARDSTYRQTNNSNLTHILSGFQRILKFLWHCAHIWTVIN